jgi:hypothetical protein
LGGDVIVVAADSEVSGIPGGKTIYSKRELSKLFGGEKSVDLKTLRLVHEARKLGGAKVTSCE